MATDHRTPAPAGSLTRLPSLGYDERWLRDRLAHAPRTLGLGKSKVIDQEQRQSGGGGLDLLAVDGETDTYYSIEVQLGKIDALHSFRVFDYYRFSPKRTRDRSIARSGRVHASVPVRLRN